MIFDQLCGIAERFLPELIPFLERAELFIFPGRPQDILPKTSPDEDTLEHFILPFPVIAVEDTATCSILIDTDPMQMGLSGRRLFIDCMPLGVPYTEFDPNAADPTIRKLVESIDHSSFEQEHIGCYSVSMGYLEQVGTEMTKDGEKVTAIAETTWFKEVHKKNGIKYTEEDLKRLPQNFVAEAKKSSAHNALTALQEVIFFSSSDRFILETRPVKIKPLKKKSRLKIPRSDNRSTYIFVEPNKIYDRFGVSKSDPVRELQAGYQRRRFVRKLRHDKYSEGGTLEPKQDSKGSYYKVAPVVATWVGPEEATIKNKRYKVRVDLWEKAWKEKI